MWAEEESIDHLFVNSKFLTPFVLSLPCFHCLGFCHHFPNPSSMVGHQVCRKGKVKFCGGCCSSHHHWGAEGMKHMNLLGKGIVCKEILFYCNGVSRRKFQGFAMSNFDTSLSSSKGKLLSEESVYHSKLSSENLGKCYVI